MISILYRIKRYNSIVIRTFVNKLLAYVKSNSINIDHTYQKILLQNIKQTEISHRTIKHYYTITVTRVIKIYSIPFPE